MKRIETLLPHVIPSVNSVPIEPMNFLEPFVKIGIVPTESCAFKLVIELGFSYFHLFREFVQMIRL